LLGGAGLAWPLAAHAQQPRRIGVLTPFSEGDTEGRARVSAFQEALREAGWVEGRNIRIDYRWAAGDPGRIRTYAAEIVGSAPEAILCNSTPALAAFRKETQTIPIVFIGVSDPVGVGFVASLARPGGNLTGFANFEPEMGGKWLQELKEVAPSVNRVAFILNPQNASWASLFRTIEDVAPAFGVIANAVDVRDAPFLRFQPSRAVPASGVVRRSHSSGREARRSSSPGTTKVELVINMKTAKTLGLDVPPMLLVSTGPTLAFLTAFEIKARRASAPRSLNTRALVGRPTDTKVAAGARHLLVATTDIAKPLFRANSPHKTVSCGAFGGAARTLFAEGIIIERLGLGHSHRGLDHVKGVDATGGKAWKRAPA
jgi:hypothetical protein